MKGFSRWITGALLSGASALCGAAETTRETCGSVDKNASLDEQLRQADAIEECSRTLAVEARVQARDRAISATQAAEMTARAAAEANRARAAKTEAENAKDFLGFSWGIGVGAGFGSSTRVSDATVVDGVVRVDKDVTDSPRIVLELHQFWHQWRDHKWGLGPFAAVNFGATDGNTLTSFGGGLMIGRRRDSGSGSFNIGAGIMLDQNVKVLGAGIKDGEPLPGGEIEVRFKEKSDSALLVFVSTTF